MARRQEATRLEKEAEVCPALLPPSSRVLPSCREEDEGAAGIGREHNHHAGAPVPSPLLCCAAIGCCARLRLAGGCQASGGRDGGGAVDERAAAVGGGSSGP
eukprot:567443-Rhodomonas_salina.2